MKYMILAVIILLSISQSIYSAVNRDSLQAATAKEQQHKAFRGEILVHFPLAVFPIDSAGGDVIWFPIPEMGFRFTPTLAFRGGWFSFPLRIMGMFPFTDDWVALGDGSIGCEVHVPPVYAGLEYRYLRGKIYPVKGEVFSHIVRIDLGIPIDRFKGTGIALDWAIYSKLELGRTYNENGISWDYYDGNILMLVPHWTFSPGGYGELTLGYRFPLMQKFKGYDDNTQASYDVGKGSFALIELRYVYP